MFRKIKNIDLPYDRQALVYYTCVNYDMCDEAVRSKIEYLCGREGSLCRELFDMITSGKSVRETADNTHIAEKSLILARKRFYENWFNGEENWLMPRKAKKDLTKRTQEIMEKALDRLEACIDDYDTPIPINQLTSAFGTLYEKGCHASRDNEEKLKVDIHIE